MAFIIGTAGHIDHGKTSLIKALTGQDTDRLKEEKERGISIDLGFAHFDLPDGTRAGVVDVPGHERFIRNMLAGAHGIDLVLFVVAADDGVMPQTEEHLDIVHLLGIERAIFVITKIDLVPQARITEVNEEIQILITGTSLESSPIVSCSCATGEGLDDVRAEIVQLLLTWKKPSPRGFFRLPVDRTFVLPGHGLIVTGTALGHEVKVGDRVRCLPGGESFRVRSLHVHNQSRNISVGGQRVALNLTGQDRYPIERGHVICDEHITRISDRFDATLRIRPTGSAEIKNHQRVRIHLGTAERLGKIVLLEPRERIGSGRSTYCQIVLSTPLLALRGDHFIIRDQTAQRTLGGGIVIHPWAARHKRSAHDLRRTMLLHEGNLDDVVQVFLDESKEAACSVHAVRQFLNTDQLTEEDLVKMDTIRVLALEGERLFTTHGKWRRIEQSISTTLRDFHAAHPLLPGMSMEELRQKQSLPVRLFRAFVDNLEAAGGIVRDGNLLRTPDHKIALVDEHKTVVEKILGLLAKEPLAPPDLKQIESVVGIAGPKLDEIVRAMEHGRSIVRVTPELYFLVDTIAELRTALCERLAATHEITPAGFRALFGTSRKYTIPLLEFFDREHVTIRIGDARRLKQPWPNS